MGLKWHEHLNLAFKIFYLIEPLYTFCNNTSNTIKGHIYDCSCSRTDRFITIYLFILFACRTAPNMKLQTRLLSCTDVLSSCVLKSIVSGRILRFLRTRKQRYVPVVVLHALQ